MRQILALVIFAVCLFPLPCQDVEPEEPDDLVPEQLLEIELQDPRNVVTGIPLEDELATDGEGPLLGEPENPPIEESDLPLTLPDSIVPGGGVSFPSERALMAETLLGAGTRNHISGRVHLYQLGSRPTFELDFSHDALDGFGTNPPGSSFYRRTDELEGSLGIGVGRLEIDGTGFFREAEDGLQEKSAYGAMVRRTAEAGASAAYRGEGVARLRVEPGFHLTTLLWKGEDPDVFTEVVGSADVLGELVFEKFRLGLTGSYAYRTLTDRLDRDWDYTLHRVGAGILGTVALPQELWLEGRTGWFYSQDIGHLFPFSLSFGGRPFGWLVFSVGGGYRVQEYNLPDLLTALPFLHPPEELLDNHGWFGRWQSRLQWDAASYLEAGLLVGWNSGVPYPGSRDRETGFFTVEQIETITLEPELSAVWVVAPGWSLDLGWQGLFFTDPSFSPSSHLIAGAAVAAPTGNLGGSLTARVSLGPERVAQIPEVGVLGFYRFTDNIRVVAEIQDILYPFMGDPRSSWKPYQEPGTRFTTKVHIRL